VSATVLDAGLYVQDEWLRPNITLSYARFETQNAIHDHADWASWVAIAWGIDGIANTLPRPCWCGRAFLTTAAEALRSMPRE
jgi:hypothetical protein